MKLPGRTIGFGVGILVLITSCAVPSNRHMTPRRALAAAKLDGRVYVAGGWNGDATQLDIVEMFDASSSLWTATVPLNHARSQHALVEVVGSIYAVGGWSAITGLVPQIERWRPGEPSWRDVSTLPSPRREPGVALMAGHIVVAGGFSGSSDADLDGYSSLVEAFEWDTGQWHSLAPLRVPRRGLQLVNVEGVLFAIGGYNPWDGFTATVERYDQQRDAWDTLPWRILPRTWAASAVDESNLVLLGGFNQHGFQSGVEIINIHSGDVCAARLLGTARSWLAAVTTGNHRLATYGGETANGFSNAIEEIEVGCGPD